MGELLTEARNAKLKTRDARRDERKAVTAYMTAALDQGLPWASIGRELNVTDVAAIRYYNRNRERQ